MRKCCMKICGCLCRPIKKCCNSIFSGCKRGTRGFVRKHILPDPKFSNFILFRKIRSLIRNVTGNGSKTSLRKDSSIKPIKSKVIIPDLNVKDIKSIENMKVVDAKNKFSVTDSQLLIMTEMVKDFKQGDVVPRRKIRLRRKKLTKVRLDKLIKTYEEEKKRADLEAIHENAKVLKKTFNMNKSKQQALDKMVEDLQTADFHQVRTAKAKFEPEQANKKEFEAILAKFETAKRKNRGLSFIISKAKLEYIVSKRRIASLYNDLKRIRLSDIVRDINIKDITFAYPF